MDLILRFSYCPTQGSLDPSTVPFQSIWQVMLYITHLLKFWSWHMGEMTVTKFIFQQIEEKSCLFLGNLSISQAWASLQCLNSEGYMIIKNQEIFLMILWQLLQPFLWFLKNEFGTWPKWPLPLLHFGNLGGAIMCYGQQILVYLHLQIYESLDVSISGQLVGITHQHWVPRPYKQAMVDGACWWADG